MARSQGAMSLHKVVIPWCRDWEMEDASLEHPWNCRLRLRCQLTLVPAGPVLGLVVLPVLGRALWGRDCLPLCVRVWCVQSDLNLSWGLWALP